MNFKDWKTVSEGVILKSEIENTKAFLYKMPPKIGSISVLDSSNQALKKFENTRLWKVVKNDLGLDNLPKTLGYFSPECFLRLKFKNFKLEYIDVLFVHEGGLAHGDVNLCGHISEKDEADFTFIHTQKPFSSYRRCNTYNLNEKINIEEDVKVLGWNKTVKNICYLFISSDISLNHDNVRFPLALLEKYDKWGYANTIHALLGEYLSYGTEESILYYLMLLYMDKLIKNQRCNLFFVDNMFYSNFYPWLYDMFDKTLRLYKKEMG